MATNPNIALSYQPNVALQRRDPLEQYGRIAAIQQAQQQNALANMQMQEYERARTEEEGTRNFLRGRKLTDPETQAGLAQFGKTGLAYSKLIQEQQTAALNAKNVQSQIAEREFGTQDKKLKFAWNAVGSASTPQAAIAELTKGVKNGVFNMQSVTPDIQRLQNMTPDEYRQYRVETIMSVLEAKDKLAFMLPKTVRQDAGGQILSIQDNPMMPGYGQPIAGAAVTKTPTFADITAQRNAKTSASNLTLAQQRLALDQQKFDFEKANPGYELKEGEDGTFYGVNKLTMQAVPVTMGGAAPVVAPAAPGAGMPGPRIPAPATQVIPGMTSVLDQPAAAPAAGVPLRGKSTALTESQGNATAYGMRMREANAILEPLEKAGKTDTGVIKGVVGGTLGLVPFIGDKLEDASGSIFNALPRVLGGLSPEQQQVMQARINFITAILRKESGAAIGANEFATAEKNYFPKPGDDAAAIAQKQQARRTAIRAMEIQAGPGAKQMGGSGVIPGASANDPLGLGIGGGR